jgi:NAD(P)H-dependent flavin oxidoreductase YrpB (nitropropane dioxygenase family)
MNSPLCQLLGIDFPLVAFSHCRDVVVAVSKAGGFGVMGASNGRMSPEQLKIELDWIDAHIDGKPYGLDLAIPERMENQSEAHQTSNALKAQIPAAHKAFVEELLVKYGVNTNSPVLADEDHDISHFYDTAEKLVDEGLRHPIRLFVNALGRPPKFMVDKSHAKGVPVGALVGSKKHALRQLEAGVDLIVAQGTEAAAHCGEISTMVLVPEIVAAVNAVRGVPVLAAGGIATGRQMAAAMAMGAAGVWTGSVWLATVESDVSPAVRDRLLAAGSGDTLRSRAMTGKTARQLRSAWNDAWESPASPGCLPMPYQYLLTERAFQQIEKSVAGGNERARVLVTEGVGQGIGLIDSSKSARAVVQEFREDFAEAIERVMNLVS